MKLDLIRLVSTASGSAAALTMAGAAQGGLIFINSTQAQVSSVTATVAQAKYRLSHTNFDQSLDRGTGTSAGNFIQAALGNNSQLSGRAYQFSLENRPGEGLVFTLTEPTALAGSVLAWGVFSTSAGGSSVTTIGGQAVPTAFNALWIEARATRAGSSLTFSGLAFDAPGLKTADGEFVGTTINPGVGGPSDLPGVYTQRLVSDTNLALEPWTFRGLVSASRDATSSGDETVKFTVGAQQVVATFVPATGTGLGVLLTAGALALRRRRSASAPFGA